MNKPFNAHDWYWIRRDGRIYSSASRGYVAEDDVAYVAWGASGASPTWFPTDGADEESEAALTAVLTVYGVTDGTLDAAKRRLCQQVDTAAELERAKYITPGAGQAMTYQAKADEARRLSVDAAPDPADYPLLSAEVGITGPTIEDVGAVVRQAHDQWLVLGGAIEAIRLSAKAAINAAETEESATIVANVVWPSAQEG